MPKPSKLKLLADASVTVVESVVPFARLAQVIVTCIELTSVRCAEICSVYCVPLAKPENRFVFPGPVPSEVQSPLVPKSDESARVVRLRMSVGEALPNVTAIF